MFFGQDLFNLSQPRWQLKMKNTVLGLSTETDRAGTLVRTILDQDRAGAMLGGHLLNFTNSCSDRDLCHVTGDRFHRTSEACVENNGNSGSTYSRRRSERTWSSNARVYRRRQGQCLATCKSLANREKNLFAGHFRGNFLRSRAWRKLCDCPTVRNKQYYVKSRYGWWNGPNWRISNNCSMRITIWEASKKWASACTT